MRVAWSYCQAAGFVLLANEKLMDFKNTNLVMHTEMQINGMFKRSFYLLVVKAFLFLSWNTSPFSPSHLQSSFD